jgi:hypothetical protein
MPAITTIKLRRGTAAQWTSANPVLAAGEMGIETDTQRSKYGDGTAAWASLSYTVGDSSGIGTIDWTSVQNKPTEFPPEAHTHLLIDVTDVTATAAELNVLDGITASTAELNVLDGITASTAELNVLDGITASTAELNVLDGITASTAELNVLDGITASTAELNLLDGVTASTTELNYVDGVTSAIQTQIDGKAASVHTHLLADITDYVEPEITFTNNFMLMGA